MCAACVWVERGLVAYDLDMAVVYANILRLERIQKRKKMGHSIGRMYPLMRWTRENHDLPHWTTPSHG